jgi:hypothetical protein
MEAMISFVDAYRDDHGVEPICKVLTIAPSTYRAHVHAAPIQSRHRRASSGTSSCVQRSKGFSTRTSRSTAFAKCGGKCYAKGTR